MPEEGGVVGAARLGWPYNAYGFPEAELRDGEFDAEGVLAPRELVEPPPPAVDLYGGTSVVLCWEPSELAECCPLLSLLAADAGTSGAGRLGCGEEVETAGSWEETEVGTVGACLRGRLL